MPVPPPTADFVLDVVEASAETGYTFDQIMKDARSCWNDPSPQILRSFLDQLLRTGQVIEHPQMGDRYITPAHHPPVVIGTVVGTVPLAGLATTLFRVGRSHAAAVLSGQAAPGAVAPLTVDHLAFNVVGDTRTLAIYDRPVSPSPSRGGRAIPSL